MKRFVSKGWKTAPIGCTCEVIVSYKPIKFCYEPTSRAYPAHGGGWMALCLKHGLKHTESFRVELLISNGETWK